ncbi:hypothetical protein YYC_03192 [Plasmodium yoelii 17X]|uniref:ER membrane protein complex subunit 4 n=3 Tax=Plasmodium yoelii TaxID=5861 RepID=A0AAF0B0G4_PLAYO|nr:ER membrane protein complex subunit 4, putative [Plasmodium yoelii]ETB59804.1 hypothetical protein YYC_03192 [Plasmodium yoelii 17X]WBY57852.1 ER membrane protein complex subunit 4 [Plasmodium yoelii yoelii]CDU84948.1 conserved protein, unknown function [Plasmodium yoelii]VTZ78844.1 ER membrane protein complex subunit 4, putative [Plasmodium yoelii]|eukprot:XP_022813273.1 ER membrane protein complex subunit 4, putative [Plasmodium yoelii]
MNRWNFRLKRSDEGYDKTTEPFGYRFEIHAKEVYGNGDSYMKPEKNINILRKLSKIGNEKSNDYSMEDKIIDKNAWNVCLNAFKGLMMNIFVMFMSGGASGIFGIIFIMYSIYNILKSLFNINDAFKSVGEDTNNKFVMQKICFALINFIALLYIMNICSNSGLLPIRSADYFYFIPHQRIKQKSMITVF